MSGATAATVRVATDTLCKAADATRDARRHLFTGGRPPDDETVLAATTLIDEAIAQLVSARAAINGTTVVEAL